MVFKKLGNQILETGPKTDLFGSIVVSRNQFLKNWVLPNRPLLKGSLIGANIIVPLLRNINTAFNPETIHAPTTAEYKEFDTGRRHPWAEDRVM